MNRETDYRLSFVWKLDRNLPAFHCHYSLIHSLTHSFIHLFIQPTQKHSIPAMTEKRLKQRMRHQQRAQVKWKVIPDGRAHRRISMALHDSQASPWNQDFTPRSQRTSTSDTGRQRSHNQEHIGRSK